MKARKELGKIEKPRVEVKKPWAKAHRASTEKDPKAPRLK
jgi:hypothetical protein